MGADMEAGFNGILLIIRRNIHGEGPDTVS